MLQLHFHYNLAQIENVKNVIEGFLFHKVKTCHRLLESFESLPSQFHRHCPYRPAVVRAELENMSSRRTCDLSDASHAPPSHCPTHTLSCPCWLKKADWRTQTHLVCDGIMNLYKNNIKKKLQYKSFKWQCKCRKFFNLLFRQTHLPSVL